MEQNKQFLICNNTLKSEKRKCYDTPLSEYSPKDKRWDKDRAITQAMSEFLYHVEKFERWAERMDGCTRTLGFAETVNVETGEVKPKLVNAFFCHCRHCQTCDARKALVRMGRFKSQLPIIEREYPKARWLLLTLTVPNCHIDDLRKTLKRMNQGWQRLIQRKVLSSVLGWIKATEVTQERRRKDYAHPHFHVLLLVPPSMLSGKNYIKHSEWLQLWRDCYRDQSIMSVNIQAVKNGAMKGAVETLKAFNYSMKINDLIERSPSWILKYMEQVHGLRFLSTGGALKNILTLIDKEASDEEMIFIDENGDLSFEEMTAKKFATWRPSERIYRMKK